MRRRAKIAYFHFRFVRSLLWEFRVSLGVFWGLVFVGGAILHFGYERQPLGYLEACYAVFLLIFLEPNLPFPTVLYLQPLFFLLPIVGLAAVADSVVRLGYLVFSSKQKLPEWQQMVASLQRDHTVVLGVGKVGMKIVRGLAGLGEPVVAIERDQESLFLDEVHDLGIPVIHGEGRHRRTLELAGVADAQAIILATDDDLANIDAALTARDIQPGIRVVMRLFDETLASKIGTAFDMPAISTSEVSAPAFIAAATGRKVYQEFQLDEQELHLTDLTVHPDGSLAGITLASIQKNGGLNVVLHKGTRGVNVNPSDAIRLCAGDSILVIAPRRELVDLERANRPGGA